jgi:hypothetical protein
METRSPRRKFCNTVSFLLAVFLLAAAPTSQLRATDPNAPLFLPAVLYGSGGFGATSVAVADFNGDGKPDLVVTNECVSGSNCNNGSVGVLLGNGDGTFGRTTTYASGGLDAVSVAVADVNGDGKPDVIVANECGTISTCGDGSVAALLGNGDGTFQVTGEIYDSGGRQAESIAIADVNGDGKPDLVVANRCVSRSNCGNGSLSVLLGNGDGTFRPAVAYPTAQDTIAVAIADVNNDGEPDLLAGANPPACVPGICYPSGVVDVLLGNGDGTFQAAVGYASSGFSLSSVAVADVNGDGKPDLLVANACASTDCLEGGAAGVLLGNGDGTFQAPLNYGSGGYAAVSVAVRDVNLDGKPDLIVANLCVTSAECGGILGVLLGNGDGTFSPAATYSSGGHYARSVVAVDVNGDQKPDLLVANTCGHNCSNVSVGVLLNNSAPFDTTPPVITLSATPKVLWPVDGKMVPVTISGTITDTGSGVNANSAAYAVQDEYGKVQPKAAIILGPRGNYSFTVLLQASRLGTYLDGRRYIVTVRASDNAGNSGSKMTVVTVPHDQGH